MSTPSDPGPDILLGPESALPTDPVEVAEALALQAMPGYLLRRLDSRAAALFEEHTEQTTLTPRQFGLLQVVFRAGTVRQSDLAALLHLDRSTLGEMLQRMIDRSLVIRRASPNDRRTSEIELTAEGRDALLDNVRAAVLAQRALVAPLPDYLRPVFMTCLQLLADADDAAGADGSTTATAQQRSTL